MSDTDVPSSQMVLKVGNRCDLACDHCSTRRPITAGVAGLWSSRMARGCRRQGVQPTYGANPTRTAAFVVWWGSRAEHARAYGPPAICRRRRTCPVCSIGNGQYVGCHIGDPPAGRLPYGGHVVSSMPLCARQWKTPNPATTHLTMAVTEQNVRSGLEPSRTRLSTIAMQMANLPILSLWSSRNPAAPDATGS